MNGYETRGWSDPLVCINSMHSQPHGDTRPQNSLLLSYPHRLTLTRLSIHQPSLYIYVCPIIWKENPQFIWKFYGRKGRSKLSLIGTNTVIYRLVICSPTTIKLFNLSHGARNKAYCPNYSHMSVHVVRGLLHTEVYEIHGSIRSTQKYREA